MLLWLDVTVTDKRDQFRKYGYAIRGVTLTYHRCLQKGERINVIATITIDGFKVIELVKGTVNGDDFMRGSLIPNMGPFPNP